MSLKLKMMEPPEPYDRPRARDILACCGNCSRLRNRAAFKLDRIQNVVLCTFVSGQISMSVCTLQKWLLLLCLLLGSTQPHLSTALKVNDTSRADAGGVQRVTRTISDSRRLRRELQALNISLGLNQDESILLSWRDSSANLRALWQENRTSGPCGWHGVTCGEWQGENRVTGINVASLNLDGAFPAVLCNLSALNSVSVASNNLTGKIPSEIGSCINLLEINFTDNGFTGHIPVEIGRLAQLQRLDLSRNSLNGSIPPEVFANCDNLVAFNISSNKLNGTLPEELGACTSLRIMDVSFNELAGEIPSSWGQLPHLEELVVADNDALNGTIPDTIFSNCQYLRKLDIAWNQFSGQLPPQLGNCTHLEMLVMQGNLFSGSIPGELGKLKKLKVLRVGNNKLSGELPQNISQCSSLKLLDIGDNNFTGPIPPWLGQLTNLQYVTMQINKFSGTIPLEVTTLPVVRYIDFSNNSIQGSVLKEFAQVSSLRLLRLSNNNMTGSIPEELGYMYKLQGLDLSSNSLTGSIPTSVGNLQDLLWLHLGHNKLSGIIPQKLTNCSSLMWLNLAHNQLRGQIPYSFSDLGWDSERVFRQNQANPWIADGVGECSMLATWAPTQSKHFKTFLDVTDSEKCHVWLPLLVSGGLQLRSNKSTGENKVLSYWQLESNNLTGVIPDLKNASSLGFLILSKNGLKGPIPLEVGNLPLYYLDVSSNSLNGSIPNTLGNASLLVTLDVAYNDLSGTLPPELGNLNALTLLNVSYNPKLSGTIPSKGQFTTFELDFYIGDYNLCLNNTDPMYTKALNNLSTSSTNVPKLCSQVSNVVSTKKKKRSARKKKIIKALETTLMSSLSTLSALLFLSSVYCMVSKCRKRMAMAKNSLNLWEKSSEKSHWSSTDADGSLQSSVAPFSPFSNLKSLTYSHLVQATKNFSPDNIIGDGGFGIVYKAKLGDGTTVAIKKLMQNGPQGPREFRAEMDTLGVIRHENLVSLLGYCCNNEEMLLVYEYLVKGSLDDWLYESDAKAAQLDWPLRLRISLETARGLSFLHHECVRHVIHRDMKSSNILLNENFKAVLTDFGMARIMGTDCTHVSTTVAGTPGYIPPEYSQTWRATTMGDVYSYGVVMLELLSGKRPTGPHFNGRCGTNLVERARILIAGGRAEDICDAIVLKSGAPQEISQFLDIAIRCTDSSPTSRPRMSEVVELLQSICSTQASQSSQRDIYLELPP